MNKTFMGEPVGRAEKGKMPVIDKEGLELIRALLERFDWVTYNDAGDMIGRLAFEMPVIGRVIVSFLDVENHVVIYREDDPTGYNIWSGHVPELGWDGDLTVPRKDIIRFAKEKIVELVTEATPAPRERGQGS